MLVNRHPVGAEGETRAGLVIAAMPRAEKIALAGNSPDAHGILRIHLVGDKAPCHDNESEIVLSRDRGEQQ